MIIVKADLDVKALPAVLAAGPEFRLDRGLSVRFVDDGGERVTMALNFQRNTRWKVVGELEQRDPELLQRWCVIIVQALNRAITEGLPSFELPWPESLSELAGRD